MGTENPLKTIDLNGSYGRKGSYLLWQILGGEDSHQKEAERTTCCLKARKYIFIGRKRAFL